MHIQKNTYLERYTLKKMHTQKDARLEKYISRKMQAEKMQTEKI
jgi:hypothetical protein